MLRVTAVRVMLINNSTLRCVYQLSVRGCNAKRLSSSKASSPLRILFCGSDAFSSASLRALYQHQQKDPQAIHSIDVVCRPGKRTGRNLKVIREVPIKAVAQELGLRIHERDTFTGWDLPKPGGSLINLIVAVSFGLFVPPRILQSAMYGGINVHPSLLPQYRGPSPLQYTIMRGDSTTGVTLQTLHPKSFDHGQILSQSSILAIPPKSTFDDLLQIVSPVGAELLVEGVRERLFVPPLREVPPAHYQTPLVHARIIKPEDREVDWSSWDAATIARRYRALGPLWSMMVMPSKTGAEDQKAEQLRVKFEGIEETDLPNILRETTEAEAVEAGKRGDILLVGVRSSGTQEPIYLKALKERSSAIIATRGGGAIRLKQITIPGKKKIAANSALEVIKQKTEALSNEELNFVV